MHKIKIEPVKENSIYTKIMIDQKPIRCYGYIVKQQVDEVPVVELEVCAVPNVEGEAIVHVSNKEEIARLMDSEEFKEFCEIWNEVHWND